MHAKQYLVFKYNLKIYIIYIHSYVILYGIRAVIINQKCQQKRKQKHMKHACTSSSAGFEYSKSPIIFIYSNFFLLSPFMFDQPSYDMYFYFYFYMINIFK